MDDERRESIEALEGTGLGEALRELDGRRGAGRLLPQRGEEIEIFLRIGGVRLLGSDEQDPHEASVRPQRHGYHEPRAEKNSRAIMSEIFHAPRLMRLLADQEILGRGIHRLRKGSRIEDGMQTEGAQGLVREVQGRPSRADRIAHAAKELGGQTIESDPGRQVGREGPPLLAIVVLVRVEMSADIPLESPAQAIRQGEGGQTHDGHEDDDGAQERRLGYAERVEQPSGGAGQEEVRAAQTHHDGLIDEVARDGEVDAEGARPEQADRDHELADEQGHRADEKVLPIQDVEEQGLAEQIEPDHEYSAQPEGQILETPPHRPAGVSQRRLEAIEHRNGGEELDDDANLTRQAELAIAEWAGGVQHEDEGREDIDAGRDGEPDTSQRKGHAPAVGNRRIGVAS